jgi:tryptophan 2,3-dioxygenase
MTEKALTYTSYLRIDDLLQLQEPRSDGPEHDEMLFIVIHQVYELWFRQLLHEAAFLQRTLHAADAAQALATVERTLTILKTVVAQLDVLETMTPLSFASFRHRLESASGFQSAQFREWEAVLGRRDRSVLDHHPAGPARERIEAALGRPSLYDSLLRYLAGQGATIPAETLERDVREPYAPSGGVEDALLAVHRERGLAAVLCEGFVDLDEGVQEWRYRHLKMVERTIGARPGTGGSAGAAYLATTIGRPMFPELWTLRSRL